MTNLSESMVSNALGRVSSDVEASKAVTWEYRGPLFIALEGLGRRSVTFISIVRSPSIQRSSLVGAQKTPH